MNFLITSLFTGLLCCHAGDVMIASRLSVEPVGNGKARVWLTRGDQSSLLSDQGAFGISLTRTADRPVIEIDATREYQSVDGFGAVFTGSSAFLLKEKMCDTLRAKVLDELFETNAGIGMSFLRLTIGSSEFSPSFYTYDDLPPGETDFGLSKFSLDKEKKDVIPLLKDILKISPALFFMGSSWSPPAWMKTGGSLIGGNLKPECYSVYADYLIMYAQRMLDEGIRIEAVTAQNEPLDGQAAYPCMAMSAGEQQTFIRDHIGPKTQLSGIGPRVMAYDHNWNWPDFPSSLLDDPETRQYITGSAFQGGTGDPVTMNTLHEMHPDKNLYLTGISGKPAANGFGDDLIWYVRNIFMGALSNWSRCVTLQNIVLDQHGAPHAENRSDGRSLLTLDTETGRISRNAEYYALAHFSKFIRPGAVRIDATIPQALPGISAVAFRNPDGKIALVACNQASTDLAFNVRQGGEYFNYILPGKSVVTITW